MAEAPESVAQSIETILQLEEAVLQRASSSARLADRIAAFIGTIRFVALHLVWFAVWAAINTGVLPVLPAFDPYPFALLAVIVALEGVLLSTFVLIKQNRMAELSDRRAHVDLQVNLLAERKVTRLLQVTERLAERLGVAHDTPGAEELADETQVKALVETLDTRLQREE